MGRCLFMRKGSVHTAPGDKPCNIIVSVADIPGYLDVMINQKGTLTVDGNTITGANTELTTQSSKVSITYTMTGSISSPRTVTVNGVVIGIAGSAGDSLSTTIDVSEGDTITIIFSQ